MHYFNFTSKSIDNLSILSCQWSIPTTVCNLEYNTTKLKLNKAKSAGIIPNNLPLNQTMG